ncbi:MAG: DUF192 domain-containing protein [Actinomycetota bacterium]|nr:DUF192 domain-containing protein [Actinomycetota bacterium]
MHGRFDGAPRAELRCPGGALNAVVAKGFTLRLLGLIRLEAAEFEPLLIPNCRSIHTYWMRTPIDIVWMEIDGERARVLGGVEALGPGRNAGAPRRAGPQRSIAALELAPGEGRRLSLTPTTEVEIDPW